MYIEPRKQRRLTTLKSLVLLPFLWTQFIPHDRIIRHIKYRLHLAVLNNIYYAANLYYFIAWGGISGEFNFKVHLLGFFILPYPEKMQLFVYSLPYSLSYFHPKQKAMAD